ncbi:MAG: hypothetical protein P8176_05205 [Gammaproteobacteria bacterium]
MSTYGLKWDQNVGLQIILTSSGVPFEALPELVFEVDALSEFEQHQAARQLRSVTRRPCTTVTNLSHLIKEPMLSVSSKPGDHVQYKLEIYPTGDRGAEFVMEYPHNGEPMPFWSALSNGDSASDAASHTRARSAESSWPQSTEVASAANACTRLTFQLNETDMVNLLGLCRNLSR